MISLRTLRLMSRPISYLLIAGGSFYVGLDAIGLVPEAMALADVEELRYAVATVVGGLLLGAFAHW